ncbi:MAG: hypothetical protein KAI79_08310 [Bacteroidales bacterium]|nr:hypothetical protein [Bacteroidales bacterium]
MIKRILIEERLKQETKYSKWYLNIIENAQSENRVKLNKLNEDYQYYERHHILPKSLFEEYSNISEYEWNGVLLTAREHFICHLCIWKHYKQIKYTYGEIKMSKALRYMNNLNLNSKKYQYLKLNMTHTKEHRGKISIALKAIPSNFKGKSHTEESNIKNSMSHRGKKLSEDTKKKIGKGNKGNELSEEHKEILRTPKSESTKIKMKEVWTKRPKIICPYCGLKGRGGAMRQWHFDNCSKREIVC